MIGKTFFSRKLVEKFLLSCCGKEARRDKRTMDFIRKTTQNVENAYKIGFCDGKNGEPLVEKDQLMNTGASVPSELVRSVADFAYSAYQYGHTVGTLKGGDKI